MTKMEKDLHLLYQDQKWLTNPQDSIFLHVFDWDDESSDKYYTLKSEENLNRINVKKEIKSAVNYYKSLCAEGLKARIYAESEIFELDKNGVYHGTAEFSEDCMYSYDHDEYEDKESYIENLQDWFKFKLIPKIENIFNLKLSQLQSR